MNTVVLSSGIRLVEAGSCDIASMSCRHGFVEVYEGGHTFDVKAPLMADFVVRRLGDGDYVEASAC